MNNDAISVKFGHLQELRQAIMAAKSNLEQNRSAWSGFQGGVMTVGWNDAAGQANQDRNHAFDNYGQENEAFLHNLMQAVDKAEQELRSAVDRARSAISL